jgi:hypothetical protein
MPAKRLPMKLVREILRLRHGGLSRREIAWSLSIGLGPVCECLSQAAKAGLGWPTSFNSETGRLASSSPESPPRAS